MSLSNLSIYLSENLIINNKYSINLDKKNKEIIENILKKSPKDLDNISNNIKDILEDNKIDIKDIPKIFKLIINLNKCNYIKNQKFTSKEIIEFIKFFFKLLIEIEYFKIIDDKEKIIEIINSLADILEIVIPSYNINCFKCF